MLGRLIKCGAVLLVLGLAGCSDSGNEVAAPGALLSATPFPTLPASPSETVVLDGAMTFWMYEGDGGCFGTISDGVQELWLWVDVDTCGDVEYEDNEHTVVEVTFNPDNQFRPGKTYTIVGFR